MRKNKKYLHEIYGSGELKNIRGGVVEPVTAASAAAAIIKPFAAFYANPLNSILDQSVSLLTNGLSVPTLGALFLNSYLSERGTSLYRLIIRPFLSMLMKSTDLVYDYDRNFERLLALYTDYFKAITSNETNFIRLIPAYHDMYLYLEAISGVLGDVKNKRIGSFVATINEVKTKILEWIKLNQHMSGSFSDIKISFLQPKVRSEISIILWDIKDNKGRKFNRELNSLFGQYGSLYSNMFKRLLEILDKALANVPEPPNSDEDSDEDPLKDTDTLDTIRLNEFFLH